jgi:hypothetical protein
MYIYTKVMQNAYQYIKTNQYKKNKYKLENTKGAIKNGQCRESGNIG